MRLSRKKGGAARPKRTVKRHRRMPFLSRIFRKPNVSKEEAALAQAKELAKIEAEIEELNRQATLLEERAYLIRKAEREAQGNSESNNEFHQGDPNLTNNEMNELVRNMSRSGIAKVRH